MCLKIWSIWVRDTKREGMLMCFGVGVRRRGTKKCLK